MTDFKLKQEILKAQNALSFWGLRALVLQEVSALDLLGGLHHPLIRLLIFLMAKWLEKPWTR